MIHDRQRVPKWDKVAISYLSNVVDIDRALGPMNEFVI